MAASLLLRGHPLLRSGLKHCSLCPSLLPVTRRSCCTATATASASSTPSDGNVKSADSTTAVYSATDPPKFPRWDESDYRKWKDQEQEILDDIEPIISLAKDILHSNRYVDGERLTCEDEKVVLDRLLSHHPHAEDKIGCGLESIMVDRHPQFRHSRCLFVIRTDGGWIDFSYQKCLRAYVRNKYPLCAERFIREHFKRGSG